MEPAKKFYILFSIALVIGFGGFLVLVGVILPSIDQKSILGPLLVLAWAVMIGFLLAWRYRVGKKDAEIIAQIKKDRDEYNKRVEEKAEKKKSRRESRGNRGAYGEPLAPAVNRAEESEDPEEEAEDN